MESNQYKVLAPAENNQLSSEGESSVGPALITMRNKSTSVRRADGGRSGTDLFDGDTLSTDLSDN